jgi:SAM-dependent methyltransferase
MCEVIGKYYSWEKLSIFFDKNGTLATPWAMGVYEWLDKYSMKATWRKTTHILRFNKTFTEFTSTRENDGAQLIGKIISFANTSTIPSIRIDYKDQISDLCYITESYNIDKSSIRKNAGHEDSHHCHPYSLFYHALFRKMRTEPLNFCEIGIAEGRSLLMWNDYFPNAAIYGFEKYQIWLDNWATNYSDKERVHVNPIDVRIEDSIRNSLSATNTQFDCIIDDSSHFFYDMIRIIRTSLQFLKPGGMIIIEDIRKAFDEDWFYYELKDILHEFQTVFFAHLTHDRLNSGCINNDKLLVLVKNGPQYFNFSLI